MVFDVPSEQPCIPMCWQMGSMPLLVMTAAVAWFGVQNVLVPISVIVQPARFWYVRVVELVDPHRFGFGYSVAYWPSVVLRMSQPPAMPTYVDKQILPVWSIITGSGLDGHRM